MGTQHFRDTRSYILRRLALGAYAQGDFRLKCGKPTTEIVDCGRVLRTRRELRALGTLASVALEGVRMEGVGGPITGADPLAVALLMVRQGLYWCGVRPEAKGRGLQAGVVVGPVAPGNRVLVVEDVLTTGASVFDAVDALRAAGAIVEHVLALVDREEPDPPDRLAAMRVRSHGLVLHRLFTLAEVREQAAVEGERDAKWRRYPRSASSRP